MTIPSNPPPLPPPGSQPAEGSNPPSNVDPTGVWTKFLTTPNAQPTQEEVKKFIQGIMQMFGTILKEQQERAKLANEELKKAAQGQND